MRAIILIALLLAACAPPSGKNCVTVYSLGIPTSSVCNN